MGILVLELRHLLLGGCSNIVLNFFLCDPSQKKSLCKLCIFATHVSTPKSARRSQLKPLGLAVLKMDADGILGNGGGYQVKRNGVTSGKFQRKNR